jgi:hypothetical protein
MGRKPKLYVPLTVTFFEDDRIIEAGDGPSLLYIAMCLRCKVMGTDGRLSEAQIGRLHRPRWRAELKRLADLGLVIFDDDRLEWFVAAWFSHNEPISIIDAKRAADRKRKAEDRDSGRNPDGFHSDSGPKEREGKERKGNARGALRAVPTPHRFDDDGTNCCLTCSLPFSNDVHAVSEAS